MSVAEVEALAWWEKRLLVEGLEREAEAANDDGSGGGSSRDPYSVAESHTPTPGSAAAALGLGQAGYTPDPDGLRPNVEVNHKGEPVTPVGDDWLRAMGAQVSEN